MTYGVPLSLGLLGLAIIAFVLWEMFRRPKDESDWAAAEAGNEAAFVPAARKMLDEWPATAYDLAEVDRRIDAMLKPAVIDLPEGKTLDDVCGEPWQRALDAELVAYKRLREMG